MQRLGAKGRQGWLTRHVRLQPQVSAVSTGARGKGEAQVRLRTGKSDGEKQCLVFTPLLLGASDPPPTCAE